MSGPASCVPTAGTGGAEVTEIPLPLWGGLSLVGSLERQVNNILYVIYIPAADQEGINFTWQGADWASW